MVSLKEVSKSWDFLKGYHCGHRHDIFTHPACFAKMLSRGVEKPEWYKKAKIGYLDIETSGLNASFGIMYSWSIKKRGCRQDQIAYDVMRHSDHPQTDFHWQRQDHRVVQSLIDEMVKYNILITYNGTRFDIPTLRSRALYWGDILTPGYGLILHTDLYFVVRSKLNIHSNRLKAVADFLGIPGKTDIDTEHWRNAMFGRKESLEEILRHNIYDVIVLEKVHKKLEPFIRGTRTSI